MKHPKVLLLCLLLTTFSLLTQAQTREGIPYQAVLSTGSPVAQIIDVRFGLSSSGVLLYEEEHRTETSSEGLFSLIIGQGQPTSGSWNNLNWSDQVDLTVTINAGGDWEQFGTTPLQAVPKSFYALTAGSVENMSISDLTDVATSTIPDPGFTLKWNGSHWIPAQDAVKDDDHEPDNELQQLNLEGNVLTLSRQGGQIILPTGSETFSSTDSSLHYLDGFVGIGTPGPQSLLHLNGSLFAGTDTAVAGPQLRWVMSKGAFRTGILEAGNEAFWQEVNVGEGSFAANHSTKATGQYSTAFGDQTQANGKNTFAGGLASLANGDGTFAFGYTNYATGIRSAVFGQSNLTVGSFSFASGTGSQANGHATVAMGEGVLTESQNAASFGTYNVGTGLRTQWRDADPIFEIGNGTNNLNRSNAFQVLKNGRTGISPGSSSPAAQLHIFQQTDSIGGGLRLSAASLSYWEVVNRSDGHLAFYHDGSLLSTVDPATGAWVQLSDLRVKEQIHPLSVGLAELLTLSPVSYQYDFSESGRTTWGFIAQEVEEIFPDLVIEHGDLKGISYQEFSVLAIKAIQEQQAIIASQEQRLAELEARLEAIESAISK